MFFSAVALFSSSLFSEYRFHCSMHIKDLCIVYTLSLNS